MTEQSNAELIADVRSIDVEWVLDNSPDDAVETIQELADALEAADRRADQAEATAEHLHDEDTREIVALTQERDAALAVVEKAEDFVTRHYLDTRFGDEVLPILATAGADVLREHDAKVRAEELREAYADVQAYTDSGAPFGHRPVEEFLLRRADRIEREAGLK